MRAGCRVLGIDISGAMVEIARQKAPGTEFRAASLFEADIPPCHAVTAASEVLDYLFDPENEERPRPGLLARLRGSEARRRLLDVLGPGQVAGDKAKNFSVGHDRAVLDEKEEDPEAGTMTRRIVGFRKVGEHYRRDDEVHRVRLFEPKEILDQLRREGFEVGVMRAHGRYPLGKTTPCSSPAGCEGFARSGGRAGV